jgi:hypothetical protein
MLSWVWVVQSFTYRRSERAYLAKTDALHGMTPAVANNRPIVPDGSLLLTRCCQDTSFLEITQSLLGERKRKKKKGPFH